MAKTHTNSSIFELVPAFLLLCCLGVVRVNAQGAKNFRTIPDSFIQDAIRVGPQPDDVVIMPEDLVPPGPGEVSRADVKYMQAANRKIGVLLGQAPSGPTGTGSSWYPRLQAWKTLFDQFLASRLRTDFFPLIPTMADYWSRDSEAEELAAPLGEVSNWMQHCGQYLIKAAAAHVSAHNGAVDAATLANFVKVFAARGFYAEPDWEDERMPVNAAGVMILNAPAVVTQLKAGPWQQAQRFLSGATTATSFFKRYAAGGDGLSVLKTNYAQDKAAIDAKFVELKNWVAQQETAAGPQ